MDGVDTGLGELCLLAIQPSGSGAALLYRPSLNGLPSSLALDLGPVSPLPLSRPRVKHPAVALVAEEVFPIVAWHTEVVRGPTSVQGEWCA